MRLIRLTTTDTQAFFDNSFNEDITINENSQICLENLVAELPPKAIIIDGSNDTISYQLQDPTSVNNGGVHSIQLTQGQYGGNSSELDFTFEELLTQIAKKLNDSLTALTDRSGAGDGTTTKEIGGMFKVSTNSKKFVELEYETTQTENIANANYEALGWTLTNVSLTNTTGYGGRSGGTLNTFDSYMYNSTELSEGAGRIGFRIRDLIDPVIPPITITSQIGTLFEAGTTSPWLSILPAVLITDGAVSQNAQTFQMNITTLPAGAQYRVFKTVADGSNFFGTPTALVLGPNIITVASVGFDRTVKFQFNDASIEFDFLSVNDKDLYPAEGFEETQGMILAVSKEDPKTWATGTIDYSKIYAGIQISSRTVPYGLVNETGVDFEATTLIPNILQTTTPPTIGYGSNPIISIGVGTDGDLFGQVLQDDGAGNQEETTLFNIPTVINPDKFYPIVIFIGGGSTGSTPASGQVRSMYMRYYPNPYPVVPKTEPNHWLTTITTEQFSVAPATFKLLFPDISLASFLGFTEKEYSFSWTKSIKFAGTLAPQTNTSYADSYIVEMLGGIELNSYDGYTKSRKDILATIPNNQDVNNILRYSSTTPYFLNIRNKQKSIIRNIRCRLLNLDYSPVVLQGQATMTLLIKDKDDLTRYGM